MKRRWQSCFPENRDRLRRMIQLRLDRRLFGRVDASDVLQEAYIDLAKQLDNYAANPALPFFLWLRRITGQRLTMVHRQHLGAAKRDAALEVRLYDGGMPEASSFFLASQLVGKLTSASKRVMRDEQQLKLQEILESMEPDDREIISLRHFEQLSNSEVAVLLSISEPAAGMRHVRALRRLRNELGRLPELYDTLSQFPKADDKNIEDA